MKHLKNFKNFIKENVSAEPKPTTKPDVKPNTPTKPKRPSPIRRDKPSVNPKPKATFEDIADRFIDLMKKRKEDIKKYIK